MDNRIPHLLKFIFYEWITLFDSSNTSDRMAVGGVRVQRRRADPYIDRIGAHLINIRRYQAGMTGLSGGKRAWQIALMPVSNDRFFYAAVRTYSRRIFINTSSSAVSADLSAAADLAEACSDEDSVGSNSRRYFISWLSSYSLMRPG